MHQHPLVPTLAAVSAAAALLAGCGSTSGTPATISTTTTADAPAAEAGDATGLTLRDGWVKATEAGMTGVFGTLVNDTDEEVHLVGARSEVAGRTELHVTVDDGAGGRVMREAEDGFTLEAGATHELAPGGDHIMLLQLTGPVVNGEELTLALLTEDNAFEVEVVARAFVGAEETYAPGDGMSDDAGTTGTAP